jgi:hypothetical protein
MEMSRNVISKAPRLKRIIAQIVRDERIEASKVLIPERSHIAKANSYAEKDGRSKFAGKISLKNEGKNPIQLVGFKIEAIDAYKKLKATPMRKRREASFFEAFMSYSTIMVPFSLGLR